MKTTTFISSFALGALLLLAGCAPGLGNNGYYSGYDPYSGGSSGSGYGGGSYDPYYGSSDPYQGGYDRGGYDDPYSGRDQYRSHKETHKKLEHKYDKAMRRLDRQEREAEEKAYRKHGGDTNDPRYQEAQRKIDRKYEHKRDKVERNVSKEHKRKHRSHGDYSGW